MGRNPGCLHRHVEGSSAAAPPHYASSAHRPRAGRTRGAVSLHPAAESTASTSPILTPDPFPRREIWITEDHLLYSVIPALSLHFFKFLIFLCYTTG